MGSEFAFYMNNFMNKSIQKLLNNSSVVFAPIFSSPVGVYLV